MKTSTIVWWLVGIIVIVGIVWAVWAYTTPGTNMLPTTNNSTSTSTPNNLTGDAAAAAAVVTAFGTHLKNVSLLAPNASSTIASEYGSFVDPTLLATWVAHPSTTPGRQTSSPWPDTITITSVQPSGVGYVVQGGINYVTSTGPASQTPFTAEVGQKSGQWYIMSFSTN